MAAPSEFCRYVMELLEASDLDPGGFGHLRQRRMFGGYGIFFDDLMFALIASDTLYCKVDDDNRAAFEAEGMGPFAYARKDGGEGSLSYYEVPPDAMEAPGALEPWAALGLGAARRAALAKDKKKARRTKKSKARK